MMNRFTILRDGPPRPENQDGRGSVHLGVHRFFDCGSLRGRFPGVQLYFRVGAGEHHNADHVFRVPQDAAAEEHRVQGHGHFLGGLVLRAFEHHGAVVREEVCRRRLRIDSQPERGALRRGLQRRRLGQAVPDLQVGLPVEVFRLHVAEALGLRARQDENVGRYELVVPEEDHVPGAHVFPERLPPERVRRRPGPAEDVGVDRRVFPAGRGGGPPSRLAGADGRSGENAPGGQTRPVAGGRGRLEAVVDVVRRPVRPVDQISEEFRDEAHETPERLVGIMPEQRPERLLGDLEHVDVGPVPQDVDGPVVHAGVRRVPFPILDAVLYRGQRHDEDQRHRRHQRVDGLELRERLQDRQQQEEAVRHPPELLKQVLRQERQRGVLRGVQLVGRKPRDRPPPVVHGAPREGRVQVDLDLRRARVRRRPPAGLRAAGRRHLRPKKEAAQPGSRALPLPHPPSDQAMRGARGCAVMRERQVVFSPAR
ncbi:MAG: hypothetical protein BJ554DRAFT_6616, partial [Olpidium bornovanus]